MGFSFKSSFNADKKSKELTDTLEKRLGRATEYAQGEISRRTEKGEGADGPLREYAESTKAYKLRTKGKDSVNLTETGQMLEAMTSKTERNSNGVAGVIFFGTAEAAQKARWNQDLRPNFFKLSKQQLQTLVKRLRGK